MAKASLHSVGDDAFLTRSQTHALICGASSTRIWRWLHDQDGHPHIGLNPISKANVRGYTGIEIQDADQLGLNPDRIYQLYPDPNELRKAAATFDGKPLSLLGKRNTPLPMTKHL